MHWKEMWLQAQGKTIWDHIRFLEESPPRCFICGKEERPWRKPFVMVGGYSVINVPAPNENGDLLYVEMRYQEFKMKYPDSTTRPNLWVCDELNYVGPSEWPTYDIRPLCHDHGDWWESVTDCFTCEQIHFSYVPRGRRILRDVWGGTKYWTCVLGCFIFNYLMYPLQWYAHKSKKSIRFIERNCGWRSVSSRS